MGNDERNLAAGAGVSASAVNDDVDASAGSPRPAAPPDWADRLRGIQSVTDAALSMLDPQALLDALVDRAREALQADTAAILLLDRRSGQLVATAASGLEEEVQHAELLDRLDREMRYFEPDAMATVLCAMISPSRDHIRISSAGHLPPIIARPGEPATPADVAPDLVVGVSPLDRRHISTLDFPPGAVLCLYTDGLVERRCGRGVSRGDHG